METRQFRAKSMAEALRETRRVLGPDALIVSARTMDSRSGLVEVTAVGGRQDQSSKTAGPKAATAAPDSNNRTDDIIDPEPWNKSIEPLREDLISLRRMVYELRRVADEAILPGFNDLRTLILESSQEQEEGRLLGPLYTELVDKGVMPKIARNLMRTVEVKLGLKSVDRRDWMSLARGLTRELVTEQLSVAGPIVPGDGARIFAFVGPSGVGKTTTMAKLASRMVLAEGMDVVMITCDTYRVGSVDQTRRYAELIGVPLVVADRPETMAAALRSYAGAEALLIDTPGRAFENEDVRADLARILAAAGEPVETHLLMAATYSSAQYGAVLKGFEDLNPSRIAVTKVDESTQYGGLLNIQSICDLPFSYLTGGHRVPEDIEVAKPGRISQLLFGPMN